MNENAKTLVFAGLALAAGLAALLTRPAPIKLAPSEAAGMVELFPDLKDPRKVKALEIVEYDEQTAQQRVFVVKQVKGVWSIPSHRNYPADANRQMADAAAAVLDLKRLGTALPGRSGRYTREDHEKYGVLDPGGEDLEAGATGVGKRVTLKDAQGKELAKFIIGKSDPDKPDIRFLRIPGQDVVYKVEIDTHPLSTKFEDWIEKDLLKLNAFDIKRITANDYSVDRLRGQIDLRSTFTVEYKDTKWSLKEMRLRSDEPVEGSIEIGPDAQPSLELVFRGMSKPRTLAEDEELDTTKLSDMRMALDDLKIVDVHRKPESLAESIRAGRGMRVTRLGGEAESLAARGFTLVPLSFGELSWTELISSEGEVRVGMNDGVEYLLRFGAVAGREQKDEEDAATKKAEKKKEGEEEAEDGEEGDDGERSEGGLTRFLMVVAQYNPDLIPPPELPALPEEEESPDEAGNGKDATKPASDAASGSSADDDESDAESDAKQDQKEDQKSQAKKRKSKKETERERIQKERDRLQKEYEDKVKKAKDRVAELNRRFADWYYVINEKTYRKIHLTHQDIIKKKTSPAAGTKDESAHDHAGDDKTDSDSSDADTSGSDASDSDTSDSDASDADTSDTSDSGAPGSDTPESNTSDSETSDSDTSESGTSDSEGSDSEGSGAE